MLKSEKARKKLREALVSSSGRGQPDREALSLKHEVLGPIIYLNLKTKPNPDVFNKQKINFI